jgi:hypothetical protein
MDDAMIVGLKEIVVHDSTVLEIADLPPGWIATRDRIGSPWTRASHSQMPRGQWSIGQNLSVPTIFTTWSSFSVNLQSGMAEI